LGATPAELRGVPVAALSLDYTPYDWSLNE
jgi:hypothetical protein